MRLISEIKWNLQTCRVQAGLTQKEVAEVIGVKPITVRRWEHGTASPTMDHGQALSELYEVPIGNIDFTLDGNKAIFKN